MATNEAVLLAQLTSSKRDPTLAVTSSIPEPCAAVSFPAMALPRRWVWDSHSGLQRWGKTWEDQQTQAGKCVSKTAYKAGNLSEEPEFKRLGWSIFFFSCGRASTRDLLRAWSSVGGG